MAQDKKVKGGKLALVLVRGIGEAFVERNIPMDRLGAFLARECGGLMTLGLGISLGAILGLLVISAFFSGSETALTAASRARMHALEQDGSARARLVNRLLLSRERLIGAILLSYNLANIAASALATSVLLKLFGDAGVAYATIVMTVLVVVFAEVLPKTYAIVNADRMALAVAPVVRSVVVGAGASDRRHAGAGAAHLALVRCVGERRYRRAGRP